MKAFIAFVAFVALGGFAWWEHTRIGDLTQELEKLRAPKPVARATPPPPSNTQKIVCPLCHGERVVVIRGANKLQTQTQPCPVCLGVGYRMLKVPPGYKICPDCKGMGIVFYPEEPGQPVRHDNCGRCGATGLVADIK